MNRSPLPRRKLVPLNVFILVGFPIIALISTGWYALEYGITWREPLAAVLIWWATGLGVTAGYHRLFAHRGYKAHPVLRVTYALLGGAACQNSAIAWCSDHRHHHTHTDTDGDPYDATRGFWYSHMGWVFFEGLRGDRYDNVPDLRRDPVLAWQHRHYVLSATATNLFLLGLAGLAFGNLLGMFIVAGLLRIVVVQHFTFFINSLCHMWGSQPWSDQNSSRDNWFLSLFTLGEGFHNYHHAFQLDYRNGVRWYHFDPTKWLIWSLSKVRLTSELRRMPIDIVLKTRFEANRQSFSSRLEAWGEGKAEEWAALLSDKREQLLLRRDEFVENLRGGQTALQDQLLAAEASLQLALDELKARRQAVVSTLRRLGNETNDEIRRELKHLKRSLREAQRSAKIALKGWERLVDEYSLAEAPLLPA